MKIIEGSNFPLVIQFDEASEVRVLLHRLMADVSANLKNCSLEANQEDIKYASKMYDQICEFLKETGGEVGHSTLFR